MTNAEMMYEGETIHEGEIYKLLVLDPFGEEFEVRGILHGNVWIVEIWEDTWESAPDMNDPHVVEVVGKAAYILAPNLDAYVMEGS